MRRTLPVLLLFTVLAGSGTATAKPKKPSLSEAFETARTVFIETRDGRSILDLSLDQEERNAILDMQDAVQDWGRYSLSRSRRDADLILVLYKGRLRRDQPNLPATGGLRAPIGHSPVQDPSDASQSGTTNNSPDGLTQEKDELRVYTIQSDGKLKGPIWRGELERGLTGPNPLLLRRLKDEVEKSYPAQPAKPQSTP